MAQKIVLVTAGGHISSFHAAFAGMDDHIEDHAFGKFELYAAKGGIEGLEKGDLMPVHTRHIDVHRAGSSAGSDRKHVNPEKVAGVTQKHDIYAIVIMGGDNHLKEGDTLDDIGVRVVGYPKTMGGDISSYVSCGYPTAVAVGAKRASEHYNTAITAQRVFYHGLFGRDTDWVLAGVAAGCCASVAIPSEADLKWTDLIELIKQNVDDNESRFGVPFALVPFSEGANIAGLLDPPDVYISEDDQGEKKLQPEWIGMELVRNTRAAGLSAAMQCHTYDLRDGPPTKIDASLSYRAGRECIQMILEQDFGKAAYFETPQGREIPIARAQLEIVGKKKPMQGTGYFDYDNLRPTPAFSMDYARLFPTPPKMEDLVYLNMLS